MEHKCFSCGKTAAPGKNLCASCLELKGQLPPHVDGPDWADSIDDHPFATVTQDDIDSYAEDDDDNQDDDPRWYYANLRPF